MVRPLVKVVSYVDEDNGLECTDDNRKKSGLLKENTKSNSMTSKNV